VSHLPFLDPMADRGKRANHFLRSDHDPSNRAAGDVSRRKQGAGTFVAFRSELGLR
jgi:hypothetical protein